MYSIAFVAKAGRGKGEMMVSIPFTSGKLEIH